MPHGTPFSERQQQQEAPGRCSASEQPEAIIQTVPEIKLLMTDSLVLTQQSLTTAQQQALSAIDARTHLVGDYAVESFKCQLWEPSRAVQDLEPGELYSKAHGLLVTFACSTCQQCAV